MSEQKRSIILIVILALILVLAAAGFIMYEAGVFGGAAPQEGDMAGSLAVLTIDTGDSDAILVLAPTGEAMLIDAGTAGSYEAVNAQLTRYGIKKLDALFLTHYHADHIGGAAQIIENYDIGCLYTLGGSFDSDEYAAMRAAANRRGVGEKTITAGEAVALGELRFDILAPLRRDYEEHNDESAVLRLAYGAKTFLFMGDAEKTAEADLAEAYGVTLKTDFLKVGHHGAKDASGKSFLALARPEIAVMTGDSAADADHVSEKVIGRLADVGAVLYTTQENGNILAVCDGQTIKMSHYISD